ncbi:cupin domain-containing protein [Ketogulonicigenium vulgare]|uniref:Aldehyde dehydrogenase-like protein n=1 Tax=Ketogulonicigenium vulgare (strain WSH-001) TaxID=759362 RepID=F9Y5V7_KETVW|nr:cupin domain-containing protein [Ketogulonicigenium vulgare]ADO42588.1 transcriptional regulator, XRE family [Ketogulonicigenium vulgare Y25]AEM40782.1 Aldehyde dehydrogenase-like protein [Ketogulonicigenium vulgare WSH-001]ALJ80949.1 aldehyde dehydrogenase [Ketogulonicigenium vulgare]ANW33717.1 aldehyde dehydrogenase [Ketogulonicigenium vulgare]AOZ54500.1 transcriptional regulator, XRE family [Ketogulonicigenium vulgare]
MDQLDIGGRLRALRMARGLSQRVLAKRVGVPNSTISLIESGRANPSVGSLKRILDGLPIGMAEFFAFDPEAQRQVFFAAEELREIGRGKISFRQVGDGGAGRALQMLREVYQPGADTGKVPLTHAGEEVGIILYGRLEVTVDGQKKLLGPGDAYAFDSTLPHRFRNPGAQPCEVVSACTPPTF